MIIKSVDVREPLLAYINPFIDEEMCMELGNKKCPLCFGKGSIKRDNGSTLKEIIVCECAIKNYRKLNDQERKN